MAIPKIDEVWLLSFGTIRRSTILITGTRNTVSVWPVQAVLAQIMVVDGPLGWVSPPLQAAGFVVC